MEASRQNGLIIVPARSGSKRIPNKNTRPFLGKPLIQWTLDAALQLEKKIDILVSTDDEKILNYKSSFPDIHFMKRPQYLAEDMSSTVDVLVHAMKLVEKKYSYVCLLQPTSPLRSVQILNQALTEFLEKDHRQLVSVRRCREIPSHIFLENREGGIVPLLENPEKKRSQDWEKTWVVNGAIYLSQWELFLERRSFFTNLTKPFEMDEKHSVDIDTEEDWKKAEAFAKGLNYGQ